MAPTDHLRPITAGPLFPQRYDAQNIRRTIYDVIIRKLHIYNDRISFKPLYQLLTR